MLTKICGLSTEETVETACRCRADFIGFVFYPPSPRAVSPGRAADLARGVFGATRVVGLFVNPTDAALAETLDHVALDLVQLHGEESPERCAAVRRLTGRPVMKALGVRDASDIAASERWFGAADYLLFDAKPPRGAEALPGGNGIAFDWHLLADRSWPCPMLLSGGLTPDNVTEAIRIVRPDGVDVSSGGERSPGIKDTSLIRAFLETASRLG